MFATVARFRSFVFVVGLLLFVGLCTTVVPTAAQIGNASLGGTVTDSSGGVISDAELTLTNKATGFLQKVSSNERGEYTFRNLTPGTYDLRVAKAGFENSIQRDIVLTINQSGHADVSLKVGAATETVTVEGENTLINFDNGTLQGGIDPETVKDLPLIVSGKPRSSASFAVLLPGVSTGNSNEAFNARINGGLQSGDEALLDGATMQEGFMSQSGMVSIQGDFQMSPDMVQEVKVLTSDYAPEYGSSTSGQITMVSKSGGNTYHGAAFEYARNKVFNAKPWNATCPTTNPNCSDKRPFDNEHDLGANIGGPIKIPYLYHGTSKHHSFFYFDWESFRQAGGSNVPTLSVPSLLERSGDFSDWTTKDKNGNTVLIPIYMPGNASAACRTAAGVGPGQQFPGNKIPSACFSPIAQAYIAEIPQPTSTAPTNNYTLSRPVPDSLVSNSNVFMTRIDHNYGDKDHFYFFWWRQFTGYNTATAFPPIISTESPTRPQNSPIARFNWEHTFSSTLTNHVTLGYLNRNEGYGSEPQILAAAAAGTLPAIPGAVSNNSLPQFTFNITNGTAFDQISNSTGPPAGNVTTRPTWDLNDTANKTIGHHTITFGFDWRNIQGNIHQHTNEAGSYNFSGAATAIPSVNSGAPAADFLLGAVTGGSVDRRTVSAWFPRQKSWALHVNDSWKLTPKFTANFGMRWDYFSPSREKYNHLSFFDPAGANPDGIPGRLAFAGSGSACQSACYNAEYPEKAWRKGFAPRLSVAYSYDQKTVVRAGYGVFFTQAFYPGWGGGISLDGYNLNQSFGTLKDPTTNQDDPTFYLDNGIPAPPQAPPFISGAYDNGHGILYRPLDANRRSYAQQWNLTIERQLPQSFFVSVAYVGNKGSRLPSSLNPVNVLNPFDPKIQGLFANTTPIDPSCKTANPTAGANCSYVPELNVPFTSDNQVLFGVKTPYPGWIAELNAAGNCSPTVGQALLPFPQFCDKLQGLNEVHGSSIYHSFQAKVEKRFSQGLYMLLAYTNSKLITDAADNTQRDASTWNASQGVISPFEEKRNRSLSPDDVPQTLSAAFVYELPFGKGKHYLAGNNGLDRVVGGWQISPIMRYSKGTPFWIRSGSCLTSYTSQGCLPGLISGQKPFLQDPNNFNPDKGPLLNPAAFEPLSAFEAAGACPTCAGVFGYTGTGPRIFGFRGPNYKNVDFAITKNTRLNERLNFILRAEFYNAFNLHMFVNDGNFTISGGNAFNTDISSTKFGQWTNNVSQPRRIQIGARFEF
jgi:Carboxypeptidase regulatory-like domain/TonB dependent receptor